MAIIHITEDNFEAEVLGAKEPVLIDFWASWCGPCKMLAPILEDAAADIEGNKLGKVGKVNVDEEQSLAARYGVMSIPTLLLFKDGEPAAKAIGVQQKDAIVAMFD